MLPSLFSQILSAPFESLEWLFGVKNTLYMNLIASTELVKGKSLKMADRAFFDLPLDKKRQKKQLKPAHFLDLSNSSNKGVIDGKLLAPQKLDSESSYFAF